MAIEKHTSIGVHVRGRRARAALRPERVLGVLLWLLLLLTCLRVGWR
jgi:hypothetical protein